ncbi:restriction endonuclease [Anaerobacillus isosaccharinicus]|uniref:Restriction endonuclease n=1 Tax=Anaerobacillus isosaccharinicus TaxID=1532552 RepID=A0A1S2L177_9BACI|nr:restriction endonuclease [Anaerobacillus isosaccharinicus]MBA5583962.1 restriction endonuclease [Anaerobacillus isosaccharinicus]QOY38535.1 restriction endonuclease [Anaerobacillus isosaccharinicus]
MARRKKSDPLDQLLGLLIVGPFLVVLYYTKSWQMGLAVSGLIFGLILGYRILSSMKAKERLRMSGINQIDEMDGFQFEYYLDQLFKSHGYKSKVTSSVGDYGADLIVEKNGQKIAIQAKRYSKPVGIKAVQEIAAAVSYYSADQGWVITNNGYTKQAEQMATSTNVKLIARDELVTMMLKMNPNANVIAKQTLETVEAKKIRCKCDSTMSVKQGKYGRFYGCDSYPRCTNIKKL